MHVVTMHALRDELEKIATTRLQREARQAALEGRTDDFNQYAAAHAQTGSSARDIGRIGIGGEAEARLTMGPRGPQVTKYYHHNSPMTRGADTSMLLENKKMVTDAARNLSPEAAQMVPEMYGYKTIEHGANPSSWRHVSEHEYVPNARSMRGYANYSPEAANVANAYTDYFHQQVSAPMMQQHGVQINDIARSSGGQIVGNGGNLVMTPNGPKLLDFMPMVPGKNPILSNEQGVQFHFAGDPRSLDPQKVVSDIRDRNVHIADNAIRKEVFNPTQIMQQRPGAGTNIPYGQSQIRSTLVPGYNGPTTSASPARPVAPNPAVQQQQQGFGDFGGRRQPSNTMEATPNVTPPAQQGFGDFGGRRQPSNTMEATPNVTPPAQQGFGDFGGRRQPSNTMEATPNVTPPAQQGFGDFGGRRQPSGNFGATPNAHVSPPTVGTPNAQGLNPQPVKPPTPPAPSKLPMNRPSTLPINKNQIMGKLQAGKGIVPRVPAAPKLIKAIPPKL